MNNKKVHIIVGNIASGKTTYARKLVKEDVFYVSLDHLRSMRTGIYHYDENWEVILRRSEEKIIETCMHHGCDLVIDDARFVLKSHRKALRDLAEEYGFDVVIHIMPKFDQKTSVDRRMNENFHVDIPRTQWEMVWKKFDLMYQEPTKEEGEIVYA